MMEISPQEKKKESFSDTLVVHALRRAHVVNTRAFSPLRRKRRKEQGREEQGRKGGGGEEGDDQIQRKFAQLANGCTYTWPSPFSPTSVHQVQPHAKKQLLSHLSVTVDWIQAKQQPALCFEDKSFLQKSADFFTCWCPVFLGRRQSSAQGVFFSDTLLAQPSAPAASPPLPQGLPSQAHCVLGIIAAPLLFKVFTDVDVSGNRTWLTGHQCPDQCLQSRLTVYVRWARTPSWTLVTFLIPSETLFRTFSLPFSLPCASDHQPPIRFRIFQHCTLHFNTVRCMCCIGLFFKLVIVVDNVDVVYRVYFAFCFASPFAPQCGAHFVPTEDFRNVRNFGSFTGHFYSANRMKMI